MMNTETNVRTELLVRVRLMLNSHRNELRSHQETASVLAEMLSPSIDVIREDVAQAYERAMHRQASAVTCLRVLSALEKSLASEDWNRLSVDDALNAHDVVAGEVNQCYVLRAAVMMNELRNWVRCYRNHLHRMNTQA